MHFCQIFISQSQAHKLHFIQRFKHKLSYSNEKNFERTKKLERNLFKSGCCCYDVFKINIPQFNKQIFSGTQTNISRKLWKIVFWAPLWVIPRIFQMFIPESDFSLFHLEFFKSREHQSLAGSFRNRLGCLHPKSFFREDFHFVVLAESKRRHPAGDVINILWKGTAHVTHPRSL